MIGTASMDRRRFIKTAGLTLTSALVSTKIAPLHAKETAPASKPNIVFILADDMGYGDLACQNPKSKIPTPNLDRLAAQGIRFTNSHSPSAVCTPTRYSILTGRYCWRSRLKKSVLWQWDKPLIEPDRLTVGDMLKQKGYHTACIGKWHLGWDWPTKDNKPLNNRDTGETVDFTKPVANGPTTRGFDYYFGDDVPNFAPYCFIENDRTVGIPDKLKPRKMFGAHGVMLEGWKLENVMPTITDRAAEYVTDRAKQSDPFFLYFSLTAPHTPIAPAEEFIGKSDAHRYGDYVYQVDHSVGQVLDALDKAGIADNTIVIFTSDNGSPARDGRNYSGPTRSVLKYGHDPSRPWRGIKADIWEGGHRVPFVARWPKHFPAGKTSDELISHVDFMATMTAVLNIDLPNSAAPDSYNILPALQGKAQAKPIREALVHHSIQGLFAIRQGKWKFVDGLGAGGFSGPIRKPKPGESPGRLYDMHADPQEKNNLYDQHPEVVKQLKALLEKYKKDDRSVPHRTA
ncbi:Arylsulfatase [Anaerohalosphaera lusitana]|uniref:Arylsulfatase n=1 Tax=Anaerohalosphaera lusitana TaxID=1936003 RepID=A0A1U9NI38_9BACT|nr:sulfatase-like hydrolase/transferase [Anaerohalosphaera lusitana]AQT67589.1 Arylsulfatase [Anaerohalosphaera lusitana]